MLNYKTYILNESKKEDKIKNKILKWFPIEYIVDKAIETHPKLAVWLVNQIIEKAIKTYALDNPIRDEDKMAKDKESKENARIYIQKNLKDPEVEKLFIKTWAKNVNEIRYIMDWVNSYGISDEDRKNLTKMSLEEVYEKADEWHNSLKAGGEMDIEEDGEILIQYPDGFYWVDLETTRSPEEADCMGHCGRTEKGDTIYSLRRKQANGKISCHITSAVDSSNKIIYQMKGKGNTKPIDKYHKYIVDLLMDDKLDIKGFGSEYLKEEDFDIGDLSKELYAKLIGKKPDINSTAWTDSEIEDMFERYIEQSYGENSDPGYGFNLVQWVYNATNFKTVMESRMWNEKVLFNFLVEKYEDRIRKELLEPEESKFKTDKEFREYYLDQFSAHIPAEKIAKKVNIEIDNKISPLENWENIFKVLDKDNILKIADGFGIEEMFTTEDERYEEFLYDFEDDVEGLMELLFGDDEEKQWKILYDMFYNDGSIYGKSANNVKKKEYVNAVYDVWNYDALVERIGETFTTKEMLEEMDRGDFHELYPDY